MGEETRIDWWEYPHVVYVTKLHAVTAICCGVDRCEAVNVRPPIHAGKMLPMAVRVLRSGDKYLLWPDCDTWLGRLVAERCGSCRQPIDRKALANAAAVSRGLPIQVSMLGRVLGDAAEDTVAVLGPVLGVRLRRGRLGALVVEPIGAEP